MDRAKAIVVVRDILQYDTCHVDLVDLIESEKTGRKVQYALRVKASNCESLRDKIEEVAQAHSLKVKYDNGLLIFSPQLAPAISE